MSSSILKYSAIVIALGSALAILTNGCGAGGEGDRCNPDLSHNECGDGLTCQQPFTCAENYCCPANLSTSSNPYCNGGGCSQPDGGADSGAPQDSGAIDSGAKDSGSQDSGADSAD